MLSRLVPRLVPVVPVAIAVGLAASCAPEPRPVPATTTTSSSTGGTTTAERSEPAAPPLADPPERFASEGVPVGPEDAVVGRTATYSYADRENYQEPADIVAIDLRTGEERWRWTPTAYAAVGLTGLVSSTLGIASHADGGELLVHAGTTTDEGAGTQQDVHHAAVTAVDAATGTVLWTVTAPLPEGFGDDATITVTGVDEHVVVCTVTGAGQLPRALVVDTATTTATWTEPGFRPIGLAGSRIIGARLGETYEVSGPLQALAVDTLAPVWTREELDDPGNAVLAGAVVLAPGRQISDTNTYLLDPVDGRVIADLPGRYDCVHDRRDTVVCASAEALIGVDAATGGRLWQLPDAATGRVQPTLRTAFHGRVYVEAAHTAVTLDARTGADVHPDAGVAPQLVVPGYGLVGQGRSLFAHPATG